MRAFLRRFRRRSQPHDSPESWTPERVDRESADPFMRHLLFVRFVLGEPLREAMPIATLASSNFDDPDARYLTVDAMRHLAEHWSHEPECPSCVWEGSA